MDRKCQPIIPIINTTELVASQCSIFSEDVELNIRNKVESFIFGDFAGKEAQDKHANKLALFLIIGHKVGHGALLFQSLISLCT